MKQHVLYLVHRVLPQGEAKQKRSGFGARRDGQDVVCASYKIQTTQQTSHCILPD